MSRLSVPNEILTDRGPNFVSYFMAEVYKFLGIRHLKTAPYRPQSNGCLEHFHHTLMRMVRKTVEKQTDWDLYLPLFLFACQEAPSSATGYSKHRHDIKAKERYFEIGDKVLIFSPVITGKRSEKLCDRWQGPYSVIGKVSTVVYLVDMPERHK